MPAWPTTSVWLHVYDLPQRSTAAAIALLDGYLDYDTEGDVEKLLVMPRGRWRADGAPAGALVSSVLLRLERLGVTFEAVEQPADDVGTWWANVPDLRPSMVSAACDAEGTVVVPWGQVEENGGHETGLRRVFCRDHVEALAPLRVVL